MSDARSALAEVTLDQSFQDHLFRLEELRSTWGTPDELLGGEFWIENIHKALIDTRPPALWYDPDRKLPGYTKLDIDYAGYIAALQVTKGTSGWQYLFADISLRDDEYDWIVDGLRAVQAPPGGPAQPRLAIPQPEKVQTKSKGAAPKDGSQCDAVAHLAGPQ